MFTTLFLVFSYSFLVNLEEGVVSVQACSGFDQFTVQVDCYGSFNKPNLLIRRDSHTSPNMQVWVLMKPHAYHI